MHQHDSLGALRCFAVFGLRLGCALHEFMLSAAGSCGSPSAEATLQSMQYAQVDPHAMSGTSALTSSLHICIHVHSWRGSAQGTKNGHITTTRVMGCLFEVVFLSCCLVTAVVSSFASHSKPQALNRTIPP